MNVVYQSSVHKIVSKTERVKDVHDEEWHVANCRSSLQVTHRVINFHTPFRHGIPSHYIVRMFNPGQGIDRKISLIPDHFRSPKNSQRIIRRSSKTKDRDETPSQNPSRLARTQCCKFQTRKPFRSETKVKLTQLQSWQSSWHTMLQAQILVTRCRNPNSVHRLQSLSSTKSVFRLPALRKNHGINNDRSTVLLSSYNKQNNTTKQNKHTHLLRNVLSNCWCGMHRKCKDNTV